MALSNIFREPRREVTETAVGLGVFGGFASLDCLGAALCAHLFDGTIWVSGEEFFSCLLLSTLLLPALTAALFFIHFIGEEICNALERHGVRLRPIDRH